MATLFVLASLASACSPPLLTAAVGAPTKAQKTRTTTTTSTTTTTTPGTTTATIGTWRAVYAPHGWVAVPRPSSEIRVAASAVRDAGFGIQLLNLGSLDEGGTIPAGVHPALGDWVSTSRSVDPSVRLMAWVNGSESANVDRTTTHPATARWLADLVALHGLDGVVLDLEPFRQDNPAYLSLLRTLRTAMPNTWIGVNAPAGPEWSSAFIAQAAGPADGILPMHYDTTLTSRSSYSARVASEHGRYVAAAGGAAAVLPVLPAYSANKWHDPAVEDITAAVAGIAGSTARTAAGAAVFHWHELDTASLRQWKTAIGG